MPPNPQSQYKIRVKTGCITCRIRRVKCDEGKPACIKCTSTGRKCDGYMDSPNESLARCQSKRRTPTPPLIALSPITLPVFDDDQERQAFSFFVNCTSVVTPLYCGDKFWGTRVLQMSLSERAILNAVCSLSALHRDLSSNRTSDRCTQVSIDARTFAFQQYNKAVANTRKLIAVSSGGSTEKLLQGLVACVLFVCYENLTGNHSMAQTHLQHGLNILSKSEKENKVPKDIVQVFQRLDLQAMSFADGSSPYPYSSCQDRVHLDMIEAKFESMEDAISTAFQNFRWIFRRSCEVEPGPFPAEELEAAAIAVHRWRAEYETLLASIDPAARRKHEAKINMLWIYHYYIFIIISTGVCGDECRHDEFTADYQKIIKLAESLHQSSQKICQQMGTDLFFPLESGIISPLFYTAIKCRDRRVRRQALALLESTNHQEGSWESIGAARVAEFVLRVEEGLAQGRERIGELERVNMVTVEMVAESIFAENRILRVSCVLRESLDRPSWYLKQTEIFY